MTTTTTRTSCVTSTWDEFVAVIASYTPAQQKAMAQEIAGDEKLAMIVRLSEAWRAEYALRDLRFRRMRPPRVARARSTTLRVDQLQHLVAEETRRELPTTALHYVERAERLRDRRHAAAFFRRPWDRSLRGRPSLERILERERVPLEQWLLAHPYGPAVPLAELNQLRAEHNAVRPHRRAVMTVAPAGMTPERALQIAVAAAAAAAA